MNKIWDMTLIAWVIFTFSFTSPYSSLGLCIGLTIIAILESITSYLNKEKLK